MSMAELETAPLLFSKCSPALLVASQRKDVRPTQGLLTPAERLGHRFPHCNNDRRKHQCVGGRDKILSRLCPRLSVADFYERGGSGAYDVTLASAKKHLINCISGTHRYRGNEYFFAAAALLTAVVELSRDIFNPRLFFRAIG